MRVTPLMAWWTVTRKSGLVCERMLTIFADILSVRRYRCLLSPGLVTTTRKAAVLVA